MRGASKFVFEIKAIFFANMRPIEIPLSVMMAAGQTSVLCTCMRFTTTIYLMVNIVSQHVTCIFCGFIGRTLSTAFHACCDVLSDNN